MTDKTKYWIELSEYDLETAEAMLETKRYLYVGFMCHQAIEKAFKAFYTQLKNDNARILTVFLSSLNRLIFMKCLTSIRKILLTRLSL